MRKGVVVAIALLVAVCMMSDVFSLSIGGKDLVKKGTGKRTKGILGTVYYATLWVPESLKTADANAIIEADEPMAVILVIDSVLLNKARFLEATNEGFAQAAASGYTTAKKDAFLKLFDSVEFKKGDVIQLGYDPKAGVKAVFTATATKKTTTLGSVAGLDLKKALFAIWLGPKPVQESLKKAMLGM
ncbi:MAG: chalcone isomerase family protein [Spirochaetota bacterium]